MMAIFFNQGWCLFLACISISQALYLGEDIKRPDCSIVPLYPTLYYTCILNMTNVLEAEDWIHSETNGSGTAEHLSFLLDKFCLDEPFLQQCVESLTMDCGNQDIILEALQKKGNVCRQRERIHQYLLTQGEAIVGSCTCARSLRVYLTACNPLHLLEAKAPSLTDSITERILQMNEIIEYAVPCMVNMKPEDLIGCESMKAKNIALARTIMYHIYEEPGMTLSSMQIQQLLNMNGDKRAIWSATNDFFYK